MDNFESQGIKKSLITFLILEVWEKWNLQSQCVYAISRLRGRAAQLNKRIDIYCKMLGYRRETALQGAL